MYTHRLCTNIVMLAACFAILSAIAIIRNLSVVYTDGYSQPSNGDMRANRTLKITETHRYADTRQCTQQKVADVHLNRWSTCKVHTRAESFRICKHVRRWSSSSSACEWRLLFGEAPTRDFFGFCGSNVGYVQQSTRQEVDYSTEVVGTMLYLI